MRVGDMVPGMGARTCRSEWKLTGRRSPGRVLAGVGDVRDRSRGWGDKLSWLILQLVACVPRKRRSGAGVLLTVRQSVLRSMLWGDRWRSRNREELRELVCALGGVWIQLGAARWRPVVCVGWEDNGEFARFRVCPPECGDHGPAVERARLHGAWNLGVRTRRWCLGTVFQALVYQFDWQRSQRRMRVESVGARVRGKLPVYSTVPEVERHEGKALSEFGREVADPGGRDWAHAGAVRTGRRVRNPYLDSIDVLSRREIARLYGGDRTCEMAETVEFRKLVQKGRRAVRELADAGFVDVETAGRRGMRVTVSRRCPR